MTIEVPTSFSSISNASTPASIAANGSRPFLEGPDRRSVAVDPVGDEHRERELAQL